METDLNFTRSKPAAPNLPQLEVLNLLDPFLNQQMYQSVSIDKWALLNLASREPRFAVSVDRAWRIAQELVVHSKTFGLVSSGFSM